MSGPRAEIINPESLGAPKGFSHGVLAPAGRTLYVAGQIGDRADGAIDAGFVDQFDQALANVLAVVDAAGGRPESVVRMTVYVTSRSDYLDNLEPLGEVWRRRMGPHYPAMALVVVAALVEDHAVLEIEATAVIPDAGSEVES